MKPTLKHYLIGFFGSLLLVLSAFTLVEIHLASNHRLLAHETIVPLLFLLAFLQTALQLRYFLHLGGRGSRGNITAFAAALGIIVIIMAGSYWIMEKLNYNMTPEQINNYLQDQGSF